MAQGRIFAFGKNQPYEITGWPKVALDYRLSRAYTFLQLHEITEGLRRGLDVSLYDNPSLDHHQMYALRIGLQNCLDVRDLADPGMPWMDMLRTLEERGDGLAYEPEAPRERRLDMPTVEEIEEMLLREPAAKETREKPVDLQEIYESVPDDLKTYISGLLGAERGIDADIEASKVAVAAKPAAGRASRVPEIG